MKIVYSGLEGSGKSLKLAMVARKLVSRNEKWFKISGKVRTIASNLKFSDKFVEFAKSKGIPITYWKDLDELITLEDCDVIIDELGNYFDSRGWENLSLDVRRWLTQADKVGIEIYGSAQDFAQVDKAFRRLVKELWYITKVLGSRRPSATKPPIKTVWGLCMVRKLNPAGYDEDKKDFSSSSIFPTFFTIRKKSCMIFDTGQKLERSAPAPYRHILRHCELQECGHSKLIHA